MREVTVLITGCGKHSKELVDCLKDNGDGVPVRVIGTNMESPDGTYLGITYRLSAWKALEPVTSPTYVDSLIALCKEQRVDVVIPYITSELQLLAENKASFDEAGIHVAVSSAASLAVLNNKIALHALHGEHMPPQLDVRTPSQASYALAAMRRDGLGCCVKVPDACGGKGFGIVGDGRGQIDDSSLYVMAAEGRPLIVQRLVDGVDYSACVLAHGGAVSHVVGYYCTEMMQGAAMGGEIAEHEQAYAIAKEVAEAEGLDGMACFDFIIDPDGRAWLLECNPRVNASIGFVRAAGANMPWIRCKQLLGMPWRGDGDDIAYGLKMRKMYDAEYRL